MSLSRVTSSIDFGKATTVNDGRKYSLSDTEKAEYTQRYPHLAPEVIDGITRQTKWSDIYVGWSYTAHGRESTL